MLIDVKWGKGRGLLAKGMGVPEDLVLSIQGTISPVCPMRK